MLRRCAPSVRKRARIVAISLLLCAVPLCTVAGCSDEPVPGDNDAAPDATSDTEQTDAGCQQPASGTATRTWVGINGFDEALMGGPAITVKGKTAPFRWAVPTRGGWTLQVHVTHAGGFKPGCSMPVMRCDDGRHPDAADFEPLGGAWHKTKTGHVWRATVVDWHPDRWGQQPTAGDSDAASTDGNGPDANTPDANTPDANTPDANIPDANAPTAIPCKHLRIGAGDKDAAHGFDWAELTVPLDPFDKVDAWMLDFTRDLAALSVTKDKDDNFVVRTPKPYKPNGIPDFVEALTALGLLGTDAGWNSLYLAHIKRRVLRQVRGIYHLDPATGAIADDSVRIRFELRGSKAAPNDVGAAQKAGWSVMAIGGDDVLWKPGGKTFFGRATVDFNNKTPNLNVSPNRGVFVSSLARFALENGSLANLISDFAPVAGGKPLGTMPGDLDLLDDGFDPKQVKDANLKSRAELFVLLDRLFSLAIAAITAHEVGHSLGMVKPGPPPTGLFGGVTNASFITAAVDEHHVDTPGMNIMQTGASLKPQDLFAGEPYFAAFNLAYLRRQIVVLK